MLELKVRDGNDEVVLQFEHSLLSLSKWEEKNKKPFLSNPNKQAVEMIDYYQDMLLTPVDPSIVFRLSPEQLETLAKYINESRTASSVPRNDKKKGPRETVTSELVYAWMTLLEIDWSAESWHLSRLMMLVEMITHMKQPEKKISKAEALQDWNEINQTNMKKLGLTEG